MRYAIARRLLIVGAILAAPVSGYAQDATLSGTFTDSTGGVLPEVAVTAVHEALGQHVRGGDRRARRLSDGRPRGRLSLDGGAVRVCDRYSPRTLNGPGADVR